MTDVNSPLGSVLNANVNNDAVMDAELTTMNVEQNGPVEQPEVLSPLVAWYP